MTIALSLATPEGDRFSQLTGLVPGGSFYSSNGQVIPYRNGTTPFRLTTTFPTTRFIIIVNDIISGFAITDGSGNVDLDIQLPLGECVVTIEREFSTDKTTKVYTTREYGDWLAAIADQITNIDQYTENTLNSFYLEKAGAVDIDLAHGVPLLTPNNFAADLEGYRESLEIMRQTMRQYAGTLSGKYGAIAAVTRINPWILWRSRDNIEWVLGYDLLENPIQNTIRGIRQLFPNININGAFISNAIPDNFTVFSVLEYSSNFKRFKLTPGTGYITVPRMWIDTERIKSGLNTILTSRSIANIVSNHLPMPTSNGLYDHLYIEVDGHGIVDVWLTRAPTNMSYNRIINGYFYASQQYNSIRQVTSQPSGVFTDLVETYGISDGVIGGANETLTYSSHTVSTNASATKLAYQEQGDVQGPWTPFSLGETVRLYSGNGRYVDIFINETTVLPASSTFFVQSCYRYRDVATLVSSNDQIKISSKYLYACEGPSEVTLHDGAMNFGFVSPHLLALLPSAFTTTPTIQTSLINSVAPAATNIVVPAGSIRNFRNTGEFQRTPFDIIVGAGRRSAISGTFDIVPNAISEPNLVTNSDFEDYGNPAGAPDGWSPYSAPSLTATAARVTGRVDMYGARVSWSSDIMGGLYTTTNGPAWQPLKEYVISWWAKAVSGSTVGKTAVLNWTVVPAVEIAVFNPPLTTSWQFYSFYIRWGGSTEVANNLYIGAANDIAGIVNGVVDIDNIEVRETLGDIATIVASTSLFSAGDTHISIHGTTQANSYVEGVHKILRIIDPTHAIVSYGGSKVGLPNDDGATNISGACVVIGVGPRSSYGIGYLQHTIVAGSHYLAYRQPGSGVYGTTVLITGNAYYRIYPNNADSDYLYKYIDVLVTLSGLPGINTNHNLPLYKFEYLTGLNLNQLSRWSSGERATVTSIIYGTYETWGLDQPIVGGYEAGQIIWLANTQPPLKVQAEESFGDFTAIIDPAKDPNTYAIDNLLGNTQELPENWFVYATYYTYPSLLYDKGSLYLDYLYGEIWGTIDVPLKHEYVGWQLDFYMWVRNMSTTDDATGTIILGMDFGSGWSESSPIAIGEADTNRYKPVMISFSGVVPVTATKIQLRFRRPADAYNIPFSIERVVLSRFKFYGLFLGDRTIPRYNSRVEFGSLIYVWNSTPLSDDEDNIIGLGSPATGRLADSSNAFERLDAFDVSEVISNNVVNVLGIKDNSSWGACTLTNMEVVERVPERFTFARPTLISIIYGETLSFSGPPYVTTLSKVSSQNMNEATLYEDGVPVTQDTWQFNSGTQIQILSGFNSSALYTLDYEALIRCESSGIDTALLSGGASLVFNGSFEIYNNPASLPDTWLLYSLPGSAATYARVTGRSWPYATRISWTTETDVGIYTNIGPSWKPNRSYIISWWAKAVSGDATGKTGSPQWVHSPTVTLVIANPPLTSSWQHYVFMITWDDTTETSGLFHLFAASGLTASGSLDLDDVKVVECNVWLADVMAWNRQECGINVYREIVAITFDARFIARLTRRSDQNKLTSVLTEDTGISRRTIPTENWAYVDSESISINGAEFNPDAIYSLEYNQLFLDLDRSVTILNEIRSANTLPNLAAASYYPFTINDAIDNRLRYHQIRSTITGISDIRDVRINSMILKGISPTALPPGLIGGVTNLVDNGDFEIYSSSIGPPDGWSPYGGPTSPPASSITRVSGHLYGYGARVSWITNTYIGLCIYNTSTLWKSNHSYIVSWWAKAVSGDAVGKTGSLQWNLSPMTQVAISNPPLTSSWQRYIFKIAWGDVIEPNNSLYISAANSLTASGSLDIDNVMVYEDNAR